MYIFSLIIAWICYLYLTQFTMFIAHALNLFMVVVSPTSVTHIGELDMTDLVSRNN